MELLDNLGVTKKWLKCNRKFQGGKCVIFGTFAQQHGRYLPQIMGAKSDDGMIVRYQGMAKHGLGDVWEQARPLIC